MASILAVLTVTLAACSRYFPRDTADDVSESRDQIRAAATADFPALAEALGGAIIAARGSYNLSGDGMIDSQQYEAHVVIEDPWTTGDQVAAAIEALGWQDVEVANAGVTGHAAGTWQDVMVSGEFHTLYLGNTASGGGEDLFLPGIDVPQLETQA